MEKTDLLKKFKRYYTAKKEPVIQDSVKASYISIPGQGDPDGAGFSAHIQALYTVAYGLKFSFKAQEKDFTVAKLEGLWWFDEDKYGDVTMADSPKAIPRSEWRYRLLIRLPDFVTSQDLAMLIPDLISKGKSATVAEVTWYEMQEGLVVQMLHTGPFSTEYQSLIKMQHFMQKKNLKKNGLHHEIYLSDFRRTSPENLKTILREPVKQL